MSDEVVTYIDLVTKYFGVCRELILHGYFIPRKMTLIFNENKAKKECIKYISSLDDYEVIEVDILKVVIMQNDRR